MYLGCDHQYICHLSVWTYACKCMRMCRYIHTRIHVHAYVLKTRLTEDDEELEDEWELEDDEDDDEHDDDEELLWLLLLLLLLECEDELELECCEHTQTRSSCQRLTSRVLHTVYIYIYIYIYIHASGCWCLASRAHVQSNVCVYIDVWMHVIMYVLGLQASIRMPSVCVDIRVCVCMCMSMFIHRHIHAHAVHRNFIQDTYMHMPMCSRQGLQKMMRSSKMSELMMSWPAIRRLNGGCNLWTPISKRCKIQSSSSFLSYSSSALHSQTMLCVPHTSCIIKLYTAY